MSEQKLRDALVILKMKYNHAHLGYKITDKDWQEVEELTESALKEQPEMVQLLRLLALTLAWADDCAENYATTYFKGRSAGKRQALQWVISSVAQEFGYSLPEEE